MPHRICLLVLTAILGFMQTAAYPHTDSTHTKDTTLTVSHRYRRPVAVTEGASIFYTVPARRFYSDPQTVPMLMEESGVGFPLILRDQSYGRESFLVTNRPSEGFITSTLDGILPLNDPITGLSMLNYVPLEMMRRISIETIQSTVTTSAGSDGVNFDLETFRSPLPLTRLHYTQELSNSYSNFEGLFSYNPSEPLNLTFALYRRAAGKTLRSSDVTFNPRVDHWWIRSQGTYQTAALDATLLALYMTGFSGINGGIDTTDTPPDKLFQSDFAEVLYPQSYDHRTRLDVMASMRLSLFSNDERTTLGGYVTESRRRLFPSDSAFPLTNLTFRKAMRIGATLRQPAALEIGSFRTRAMIGATIETITKDDSACNCTTLGENRLSFYGSDSLVIGGDYAIRLSGFFRGTYSRIDGDIADLFLPSFGAYGTLQLSRYFAFGAGGGFLRERASLSPQPSASYDIRSLTADLSFGVPLSLDDSLHLGIGYTDRSEPDGIIFTADSVGLHPEFQTSAVKTRAIRGGLDLWFGVFRLSSRMNYSPAPADHPSLTEKMNGMLGIYYENELSEGNLRFSAGLRSRYINRLSPTLTYDPVSDHYGSIASAAILAFSPELTKPKYLFDILISAEVDRRAQISTSFLNILGEKFYTIGIYPRASFLFRLDVTWTFLD
jgi:hypothetical protein